MKELTQEIVSSIVTKPEEVVVNEFEENGSKVFEIKVDESDMSRIIGKEGRVIRSIRNVLRIAAIKRNERIFIRLADDRR